MSLVRIAPLAVVAALALAACGTSAKPQAGTAAAIAASRKGIDDPRTKHIDCLRQYHIGVHLLKIDGDPSFQVGVRPTGPTVQFLASPGAAQYAQIDGSAQGAEIIGSALLYPNQAPDGLLNEVETCVEKGVQG